jgi:hypothetical protein
MIESIEWAEKHVCYKITNPNYKVLEEQVWKIGKTRFVRIRLDKEIKIEYEVK